MKKPNNAEVWVVNRFLSTGMTLEEVSAKMDVSVADLRKILGD